jgi:hypothetical protein
MSKKFSITIIEAPDQNQRENPNNQFSNSEPMTFAQKVDYVKNIDMTNNKQQPAVDSIIEFCQKQMDNDSSIHKGVYLSIIKFCKEQITEESEIHCKTTLLMMTSTNTANVDLNKPLTKITGL